MPAPWLRRVTLFGVFGAALSWSSGAGSAADGIRPLIANGGFEEGAGGGWQGHGEGFALDAGQAHGGRGSARCESRSTETQHGVRAEIRLDQRRPAPVLVSGWSSAEGVSGGKDEGYSLYVDLLYTDGTPLWGQYASFSPGTHGWERRQVLVLPTKPIRSVLVYGLYRHHTGTVWFDDFDAREITGPDVFDGQILRSPRPEAPTSGARVVGSRDGLSLSLSARGLITGVRAGGADLSRRGTGGFMLHDLRGPARLVPLRGGCRAIGGAASLLAADRSTGVRLSASILPAGKDLAISGELSAPGGTDRAVTLYLAVPIDALGWSWAHDIRRGQQIEPGQEYSYQVRAGAGATGGMSLYPFACVSNEGRGLGVANQVDHPDLYRIFYNSRARQLVIAWDFSLTQRSAKGARASFACTLFYLGPEEAPWGFRAAAQHFYRLNPAPYARRAKDEGIWMPFTDPATVQNWRDFGFAYHEGDNSVRSDDRLGIASFRYTEPMSYWMPMPPEMPRTFENMMALLRKNASGDARPTDRDFSRATLRTGTWDPTGRLNHSFRNEPWANGAVFVLNPNPALPANPDKPTRASLAYSREYAARRYSAEAERAEGRLEGEYLDSLEGWGDTLDFRPSNLKACPYPLTFDTDSHRPVLPQWFSTYQFTRHLSDDLHRKGRLLFANSTPIRYSIFAPALDVMGIEVNWLDGERFNPEPDEVMNVRRTMAGKKPYLLLMNTNYDRFGYEMVERYFQRCLFYGIYPGMFSADAATHPYWENPAWYNRDRPLFKKYLPALRKLSAAGWEPITHARPSDPRLSVERFGANLFTVLNPTETPITGRLVVDLRGLRLGRQIRETTDLVAGGAQPVAATPSSAVIPLRLAGGASAAIELR